MDTILLILFINKNYRKINILFQSLNNQTYINWKLIVICNNKKYMEDFVELEKKWSSEKIVFQSNIDKPYYLELNKNISLVFENNFSHLMIINDNDEYYPNFLKLMHGANKEFTYGNYHTHGCNVSIEYNNKTVIKKYNGLCNAMWSKKALQQIGIFDEK